MNRDLHSPPESGQSRNRRFTLAILLIQTAATIFFLSGGAAGSHLIFKLTNIAELSSPPGAGPADFTNDYFWLTGALTLVLAIVILPLLKISPATNPRSATQGRERATRLSLFARSPLPSLLIFIPAGVLLAPAPETVRRLLELCWAAAWEEYYFRHLLFLFPFPPGPDRPGWYWAWNGIFFALIHFVPGSGTSVTAGGTPIGLLLLIGLGLFLAWSRQRWGTWLGALGLHTLWNGFHLFFL